MHLESRTACWAVIAGPHRSTAPPARASRWSTAWTTPRTCKTPDGMRTSDAKKKETTIVCICDDWRMDGRPTGRRWRTRSRTSGPTLWWPGMIPPGRASNCDKADTAKAMKHVTHTIEYNASTGGCKALKVTALISVLCYSAHLFFFFFGPSFSSLSRVHLFRYFQVGGLDPTLIHQINQQYYSPNWALLEVNGTHSNANLWNCSPGNALPILTRCVQKPFYLIKHWRKCGHYSI